jgi:hypothetical protein
MPAPLHDRNLGAPALLACIALLACGACRPSPTTVDKPPGADTAQPAPVSPPAPFEVIDGEEDLTRWLFVQKTREGAKGGWTSGSFDRPRNKLEIQTQDVQQFALHLERVPIDWNKLVVLSIDGKNSELRRREHSRIHMRLDEHGKWTVVEP